MQECKFSRKQFLQISNSKSNMSFLDSMWNASVKEKVDGKSVVEALTLRRLPWFLRQCVELLDQTNPSKTPSSNLLLLDSVVCTATATLDPSLPPAPAKAAGASNVEGVRPNPPFLMP